MTAYMKILSHSQHSSAGEQGFGFDTLLIKVRYIGIDIYLEDDSDRPKRLLTRIPINPEFEVQEKMTWDERMERVGPLVDALCKAFETHGSYHVRVQASLSKMSFSW